MTLEYKFSEMSGDVTVEDGTTISGYASLFGKTDQGGDMVSTGAYGKSLGTTRKVKMLWQHDPTQPIGVWDEVREDKRGLYVKGRLLTDVARAREAAALLEAGAIEGLSIGYRTVRSKKDDAGRRRLVELELWEVSLVTFPMLPDARVGGKSDDGSDDNLMRDLAAAISEARRDLAQGGGC